MVDPFNHAIPGQDTTVMDELARLPAMTQTEGDKLPGINSGRFVIAVTAVGANVKAKYDRIATAISTTPSRPGAPEVPVIPLQNSRRQHSIEPPR